MASSMALLRQVASTAALSSVSLQSSARPVEGPSSCAFPSSGASASGSTRAVQKVTVRSCSRTRAVASANVTEASAPSSSDSEQKTKYYFLVANAKFMLDDEEHFQELMKERLRHFGDVEREQDFWLLYEPDFLENYPDITKRLSRPAVALISTDSAWITFMKLRLDRVLKGEIEASSPAEVLTSKPVDAKFEKPGQWVAPYPKYEGQWWTPFLPPQ